EPTAWVRACNNCLARCVTNPPSPPRAGSRHRGRSARTHRISSFPTVTIQRVIRLTADSCDAPLATAGGEVAGGGAPAPRRPAPTPPRRGGPRTNAPTPPFPPPSLNYPYTATPPFSLSGRGAAT